MAYFIFSRSYGEQNRDEHRIGRNGRSLPSRKLDTFR